MLEKAKVKKVITVEDQEVDIGDILFATAQDMGRHYIFTVSEIREDRFICKQYSSLDENGRHTVVKESSLFAFNIYTFGIYQKVNKNV